MSNKQSDKVNLYINSKFRKPDEKTTRMTVIIPAGLLRLYGNDYFTISVNGFYCFSTFYQMYNSFNNNFSIIFRNNLGATYETNIYGMTCVGNPTVYNIRDDLNTLLLNICTVTYNKIQNKFTFTRTKAQDNNYYKMYLKVINCGQFLGFTESYEGKEIEVTTNGLDSYQPINVIAHQQIQVSIDGDIQFTQNNLDNIGSSSVFKPSGTIFYKSVDVETNKLLVYDNYDANASFQYKLSQNEIINQFTINITNQDGIEIPDFPDWSMCIQFEKRQDDNTETILMQIKEFVTYIFLLMGNYILGK